MKIGHIELFVKDSKKSLEFYCNKLGFEHVSDQGEFQWIKSGSVEILLRPGENEKSSNYEESSHGIVLYSDNFDEICTRLKSMGVIFDQDEMEENCLYFTDPDGHWFQLVDPNH